MSNSTRKKDIRRTPLSQLHNTASITSEKLSFTQDSSMSKQSMNSAPAVSSSENKQDESEYTKVLKKALKEAVDENETLRNRVVELEALLSAAQDEIEEKDKAILELFSIVESQKPKDANEKDTKNMNNSGSPDENGKDKPAKPSST